MTAILSGPYDRDNCLMGLQSLSEPFRAKHRLFEVSNLTIALVAGGTSLLRADELRSPDEEHNPHNDAVDRKDREPVLAHPGQKPLDYTEGDDE